VRTSASHADIELEGVTRRFGPLIALAPLDLTLPTGSSVAVMGANGAGKTTLLRVIAGLAAPTSGRVRIAGIDRAHAGPGLRALLGYVGHERMLYGELTVRENLAFHAALQGLPRHVVDEAAATFELTRVLDRPVRTLSRGNTQRAALARALLHDPRVLLLDEPYTGLDLASADRLTELLATLHRRGRTIVMTVHDAAQAVHRDRLLVFHGGRLIVDRPPVDVASVTAAVRGAASPGPAPAVPTHVGAVTVGGP
jgi:heme ABC exporter ATP-binding subunit CcmA